jgi:flagellar biosynthetic protein FlhB
MTQQEFKDELKTTEGDPRIKRRIRSVQYQMHRRRMMAAVPEADVVVTNPVHLAVALRYDVEKAAAPEVIAKGPGYIAEKIKALAEEHDIPIVENPALAQTLFKTCEVGECIPPDLYKAVAEVLAYVYKLKGRIPA